MSWAMEYCCSFDIYCFILLTIEIKVIVKYNRQKSEDKIKMMILIIFEIIKHVIGNLFVENEFSEDMKIDFENQMCQ